MPTITIDRLRWPWQVEYLPVVARFYLRWYRGKRRSVRKFNRMLFRFLYRLGFSQTGRLRFNVCGRIRNITFNARNTQFLSIYGHNGGHVYEAEVAALLEVFLKDDAVFYDIGANFGHFSLYLGSRPTFKGKVFAFEPNKSVYVDLCAMIEQADLGGVIQAACLGISSESGQAGFGVPDNIQSGYGKIERGGRGKVIIDVERLDGLNLPDPGFIKIDVEGHEYEALASGEALIARAKPHIVFENWYEGVDAADWQGPFHLLSGLGYHFYYPEFFLNAGNADGGVLKLTDVDINTRKSFHNGANIFAVHGALPDFDSK